MAKLQNRDRPQGRDELQLQEQLSRVQKQKENEFQTNDPGFRKHSRNSRHNSKYLFFKSSFAFGGLGRRFFNWLRFRFCRKLDNLPGGFLLRVNCVNFL